MIYFQPDEIYLEIPVVGGLGSVAFSAYYRLISIAVKTPAASPGAAYAWDITRTFLGKDFGVTGRGNISGDETTDEHKTLHGNYTFTISGASADGTYPVLLEVEKMIG